MREAELDRLLDKMWGFDTSRPYQPNGFAGLFEYMTMTSHLSHTDLRCGRAECNMIVRPDDAVYECDQPYHSSCYRKEFPI